MPHGDLKINGYDAYDYWGISLTTSSISALMTPAPQKEFVSNKSRNTAGKRSVQENPQPDERQITLMLQLTAPNEGEFFRRYALFCEQLATGVLNIETKYQPGTIYKTEYVNCTQFTQFVRQMASFSLRLTEPDPTDRAANA